MSQRLNPRNWSLPWKLVAVGLVPAVLALVLGVLQVVEQAGEARELEGGVAVLEVHGQVAAAADVLREERDQAVRYVAADGIGGDRAAVRAAFDATDAAFARMRESLAAAAGPGGTVAAAVAQTEARLTGLADLRSDVLVPGPAAEAGSQPAEAGTGPAADAAAEPAAVAAYVPVLEEYTELVGVVEVLDRAMLRELRAPETAGLAEALTRLDEASEALALQHTAIGAAIRSGTVTPDVVATSAATQQAFVGAYEAMQVALSPEQVSRYGDFVSDGANAARERLRGQVLATPADRPVSVTPAQWDAAYQESAALVEELAGGVRAELVAVSAAATERANNRAGIGAVVLLLGLALTGVIITVVARSLLRSLRLLRTSALDVAERRLPAVVDQMRAGEAPNVTVEPVPLESRDEIGQVARAFDAVHGQAVRLAAEQAALQANVSNMFVNLSRRSQALIERQLQLIEQLERNEQDADQLSNLFQLDHLATRMRRNSENLLVLAGTDLAKRNTAPVPIVDVLRAAVSEVEQYQRIVVQAPPQVALTGRAAGDVVHLLAELLDNATNFSPPDSQVVMSSARTADGSVVVEIADRGVGMVDAELADANQRLGGPAEVDVSASRRMGLFVVGRLAARHGIGVRLGTSTGAGPGRSGGLTATVTVPAHLVPSADAREGNHPQLGVPARPAFPAQAGPPAGEPTAAPAGPPGSLSSLVAGADGPMAPTAPFEPVVEPTTAPPAGNGADAGRPTGLPARRPGSALRPERRADEGKGSTGTGPAGNGSAPAGEGDDASEPRPAGGGDQRSGAPAPARGTTASEPARRPTPGPTGDPAVPVPQSGDGGGTAGEGTGDDSAAADHADADGPDDSAGGPDRRTAGEDGQQAGRSDRSGPAASAADGPGARPGTGAETDGREPGRTAPAPDTGTGDAGGAAGTRTPGTNGRATDAQPDADDRSRAPQTDGDRGGGPSRNGAAGPATEQATEQATGPGASGPNGRAGTRPTGGERDPAGPGEGPVGGASTTARPSETADRAAAPRPRPGHAPDGLFAPAPPATDGNQERFERGETTPIFEEIASAWFRSNRQIPVTWQDGAQAAAADPADPGPAPDAPASPAPAASTSGPETPPRTEGGPDRAERPPAEARSADPAPARIAPLARRTPVEPPAPPAPTGADSGFAGPADEGWRAASTVAPGVDRSDELTSAGLPKRRPRARLVPGSAGAAVLAPTPAAARSAETVRGRLSSYQQGVRQGRAARQQGADATDTEPTAGGGRQDEDQP